MKNTIIRCKVYLDHLTALEPRMSGWSCDYNIDFMHFQHYSCSLVTRINAYVETQCLGNWDPDQENVREWNILWDKTIYIEWRKLVNVLLWRLKKNYSLSSWTHYRVSTKRKFAIAVHEFSHWRKNYLDFLQRVEIKRNKSSTICFVSKTVREKGPEKLW